MNDDLYATMLRLYRESRPAEILPVSDAMGGLSTAERSAQDEFMRVLLVDRNAVMAERAAPLIASGGAFIAVGALHLTGKDGLIERFRVDGYAVSCGRAPLRSLLPIGILCFLKSPAPAASWDYLVARRFSLG